MAPIEVVVPPAVADAGNVEGTIASPAGEGLRFERDGLFHVFTIGKLSYRLGGVRPLFVTSLRVNVRAVYEGLSYYDSLDLYTAKARGKNRVVRAGV